MGSGTWSLSFSLFRERADVSLTCSFRKFPFATQEHYFGAEFLRRSCFFHSMRTARMFHYSNVKGLAMHPKPAAQILEIVGLGMLGSSIPARPASSLVALHCD